MKQGWGAGRYQERPEGGSQGTEGFRDGLSWGSVLLRQKQEGRAVTSQALLRDLGCRQALPRLIEQLVPSGQPETAHTPAHLG